MKMKKVLSLLLAAVMTFSLVACAGGSSASNEAGTQDTTQVASADAKVWGIEPMANPTTLRIGFFTGSPLSYPFLFADKLGIFDKLNIKLEYICFTGGPAMMEANANWDLASCGLGGLANALKGYENLDIIDITDYEENLAIFARKDSPIAKDPKNPEVWKGVECVYPTGTTAQAVLAKYLQNIGLSLADVKSTNADNANSLTVFKGGTGDVLGCWNAIALSAEDAGFVRISDSGQLNIGMPCGTVVKKEFLNANRELVEKAVAVFHLATEWCYESNDNLTQAAQWYFDHCEEEGFLCTREVAQRTMEWYRGPKVDEYINIFTKESADDAGLYTKRNLLQAEKDILVGIDFFIAEGKYTNEDRASYLDNKRISNSVALGVKKLLNK